MKSLLGLGIFMTASLGIPVVAVGQVMETSEKVYDAVDFGVVVDDDADDSVALQAAIDAAAAHPGRPLVLPVGQIDLFDPIVVERAQGLEVRGKGPRDVALGGEGVGSYTHIKVHHGGYGILINDGKYCKISGFSMEGPVLGSDPLLREGTGLCFRSKTNGLASAFNKLEDLLFMNFDTAVSMNSITTSSGSQQASDVLLERCFFWRNNIGYETIGQQSVNHNFISCTFQFCEEALRVDTTSISMIMPTTYNTDTFIAVTLASSNTGNISVINGRFDGANRMVWLRAEPGTHGFVAEFRGCSGHAAVPAGTVSDPQPPLVETVSSSQTIEFNLCRNLKLPIVDSADPGVVRVNGVVQ